MCPPARLEDLLDQDAGARHRVLSIELTGADTACWQLDTRPYPGSNGDVHGRARDRAAVT